MLFTIDVCEPVLCACPINCLFGTLICLWLYYSKYLERIVQETDQDIGRLKAEISDINLAIDSKVAEKEARILVTIVLESLNESILLTIYIGSHF